MAKQIGLNKPIAFDTHTGVLEDELINASPQALAESVYETFAFERFVVSIKNEINKSMNEFKGTPGEKYRGWKKLIDKVPNFNVCFDTDEDTDTILGINEHGVCEVLKSMGYITRVNASV